MAVISDLLITALLQTEFISQTTTAFAGLNNARRLTLPCPLAARAQCDLQFLRNPEREAPANGLRISRLTSLFNSERGRNSMSSGASVLTITMLPIFIQAVRAKDLNKSFFPQGICRDARPATARIVGDQTKTLSLWFKICYSAVTSRCITAALLTISWRKYIMAMISNSKTRAHRRIACTQWAETGRAWAELALDILRMSG